MSRPATAVVVIGRNESARLDRCFASVRAVDYPSDLMELIYVDSGSSDNSVDIARRWGARVVQLTDPPFSAARGREAGWRTTTAPFIFFLDGDCVIEPRFFRRAIEAFADEQVGIVWGRLSERSVAKSWFSEMLALRYVGLPCGNGALMGGNHMNRRSVLEEVDGFDLTWESMENADLGRRVRDRGYMVIRIDEAMAEHDCCVKGWRAFLRRGFRFGYGDSRYLSRLPQELPRYRSYQDLGWRLTATFCFLGALTVSLVVSLLHLQMGVILGACLFLTLILARAWNSRGKTPSWSKRLQYGLYAQLLCAPVIAGHITYWYDTLRGANREIDYWQPGDRANGAANPRASKRQTDTATS